MARERAGGTKEVAPRRGGGGLAKWEEQLANDARTEADNEQLPGGQFLSIKAGQLTLAGQPIEGNQIDVVIADHIFANTYYQGRYDADNPSSPHCFAFAREEETMAPDPEAVTEAQSEKCAGCPMNEFNTADEGRRPGKACKNGRRLALLSGEDINPSAAAEGEIVYLMIPPTSLKGWAYYVKSLSATYRRPTYGVVTTIGVVPDQKDQVRVTFQMKELLDEKTLKAVIERRPQIAELIAFPYAKVTEQAAPRARPRTERAAPRPVRPLKKAAKAPAPAAARTPGKFRVPV